jgi:HAE1 family hydrophobic/amphiphilic exporter-1
MGIVTWSLQRIWHQLLIIVIMVFFSVATVIALFPKMEYLPQGNQNFIMNIFVPPPGLSVKEKRDIGEAYFNQLIPHYRKDKDGLPPIRHMFFVASGPLMISGVMSTEEQRARELIPFLVPIVNSFPGVVGLSLQRGVFEKGIGEGRSIDIDISGNSIEAIANAGGMLFGAIKKGMPGAQIRPVPSIELLFPEVRFTPDRAALMQVGLNSTSFGVTADILMDGRKIGEFKPEGEKALDLILKSKGGDNLTPESLYTTQIATPKAGLIPLSSLATMERTTGISEIRHVQGVRTITLQVTPPMTMTLEEAMEQLEQGVLANMQGHPLLKQTNIDLTGQADKLVQTVQVMQWNMLLALVIIYLLMSALFSNFIYPLVIMFTVPLAMAGGFIGLYLTDTFVEKQPLDVLTMMGFIILIGIVVNNAILIVHQTLNNIRLYAMTHKEAIITSTKSRLRPIFMSSLTSVFGMLPLVLMPGPGSEFYRGLGSVITGGLAFSTLFTILLTPALLYFVIKMEKIKEKK